MELGARVSVGLVVLCCTMSIGTMCSAEPGVEALRGIDSVHVMVAELGKDASVGGLSAYLLRADAELLLRGADIPVAKSRSDRFEDVALEIRVHVTRDSSIFCYVVDVSCYQKVVRAIDARSRKSRANDAAVFDAVTWIQSAEGFDVAATFRAESREAIASLIEMFIADYRAANPAED